jgi:SAM-dependent methyltransferase
MRGWLLEHLVCPTCRAELVCEPGVLPGDDLEEGTLQCDGCNVTYPIVRGVPRLATSGLEVDKQRTVDAFGWQWQEFEHVYADQPGLSAEFLEWVKPIDSDFLAGKLVLDAGCGMGRFTVAAASLGAGQIVGVDLSESVEAARHFTRSIPNIAIVQADLYHLPFRDPFDLAFSIGVIHHLPDPEEGIKTVGRHVKPGGSLFVWVYGHENNGWIRNVVDPVRKMVTSRLPRRLLYALSAAVAAPLQLVLRVYRRPQPQTSGRTLPYYPYLHWLSQYDFRHNLVVVFDHLVAPTAVYVKREELRGWLERAGFSQVALSARNNNSWRGLARR